MSQVVPSLSMDGIPATRNAVYFIYVDGVLLYVGVAKELSARFTSDRQQMIRALILLDHKVTITYRKFDTYEEAVKVEAEEIKRREPPLNRASKTVRSREGEAEQATIKFKTNHLPKHSPIRQRAERS